MPWSFYWSFSVFVFSCRNPPHRLSRPLEQIIPSIKPTFNKTSFIPTHKGLHQLSKDVTQTHQQRPELPTVPLTWHASKYKVPKLHQRYILFRPKTTTSSIFFLEDINKVPQLVSLNDGICPSLMIRAVPNYPLPLYRRTKSANKPLQTWGEYCVWFTLMTGQSYRSRDRSLLCLCDVFRWLVNSLCLLIHLSIFLLKWETFKTHTHTHAHTHARTHARTHTHKHNNKLKKRYQTADRVCRHANETAVHY